MSEAIHLEYEAVIQKIPQRERFAHKGDFGHVCVIGGGAAGLSGAVCLAGEAALRAGAGLTSAIVAPESLPLLARAPAELMSYGFDKPKAAQSLLERATVIVLGSGLGQTKWAQRFFNATLTLDKPKVVDADGLNWLAKYPQKREDWILTPHPKEAARLLNESTHFVQENRLLAAQSLKAKYGGVIVLKGADTIILTQTEEIFIQVGGLPVLATGGTGDVLAGLIGGLLAQGSHLSDAAKIGVSVHANAAQLEQLIGERGMLASDLFLHIRSLLNPQLKSQVDVDFSL